MARKDRRTPQVAQSDETPRPSRRPRWDWIAAAIAFLGLAWFVTEGDWNLFAASGFLDSFYDAQANSLLEGRIDVDPAAIASEAFVRDGKSYGYFGPTPALFRMPVTLLLPEMYGRWSRFSMLCASLVMLGSLLLLIRELERQAPALTQSRAWKALAPAFVLSASVGSTHFYLCAESKLYYESILWGGTLSFAAAVALVRYLTGRDQRRLVLTCVLAFLAFFARVSSGAGPVFALLLLDLALLLPAGIPVWRPELDSHARRRAITALSITVLATALCWGALNYWKFGMVFTSQPLSMNLQYTPDRLADVQGELASFHNLPVTVTSYFSPANVRFNGTFPWVNMAELDRGRLRARFPRAHLDRVEQFASLPTAMPALLFAAFAGTVLCFYPRRNEFGPIQAPLFGSIAGCGVVFIWGLLTYRYLHDVFPWLVLGTAVALACLATLGRRPARLALIGLFAAGTAYGMWVNVAFGLLQQRVNSWTIPLEKRFAFADLAKASYDGGLGGMMSHLAQWRAYRPGQALDYSNVQVDRTQYAEASYIPALYTLGSPPFLAGYSLKVPADGDYDLAIRYASPEPRPVLLNINGKDVGYVCAIATGGAGGNFQRWVAGGRHRLPRGDVRLRLSANQVFPHITMLRLVKAD
jgi:hypothetical protein